MINERLIENIKVVFRRNAFIYKVSLLIYYPIRLIHKIKLAIKRKKLAASTRLQFASLDNGPKVFYFGVPTHENLGDAAQYMCIRKWIRDNFTDRQCLELTTGATYVEEIRNLIKQNIHIDDVIIFQSGATFGYLHEDHTLHRYILENFKDNKILFLPQTVDFSCVKELVRTSKMFNNAKNAFFLARDVVSYDNILKYFDNKRVDLCPDIVTTLIGNFVFNESERTGILLCKRIDGEKKYSDYSVREFIENLEQSYGKIDWTDTNFFHSYEKTMSNIENEILDVIEYYAKYKVIITDRYHGMIFSLIANTPVVVLGTNGHKVKEGAMWFNKIYPSSIFFCETLEEAQSKVESLMTDYRPIKNASVFKEQYYNDLKSLINF